MNGYPLPRQKMKHRENLQIDDDCPSWTSRGFVKPPNPLIQKFPPVKKLTYIQLSKFCCTAKSVNFEVKSEQIPYANPPDSSEINAVERNGV